MSVEISILSLHTGRAEPIAGKPGRVTAIRKTPAAGPLRATTVGFADDTQCEVRHHGGPLRALCAYDAGHYDRWRAEVRDMPAGSFGENLSLRGAREDAVCLGDVYLAGGALLRVTVPRGPCGTLAAHWACGDFAERVRDARATGFYLQVLEEGPIAAGDQMVLEARPFPAATVARTWDAVDHKDAEVARLLDSMDFLTDDWKKKVAVAMKRLAR